MQVFRNSNERHKACDSRDLKEQIQSDCVRTFTTLHPLLHAGSTSSLPQMQTSLFQFLLMFQGTGTLVFLQLSCGPNKLTATLCPTKESSVLSGLAQVSYSI